MLTGLAFPILGRKRSYRSIYSLTSSAVRSLLCSLWSLESVDHSPCPCSKCFQHKGGIHTILDLKAIILKCVSKYSRWQCVWHSTALLRQITLLLLLLEMLFIKMSPVCWDAKMHCRSWLTLKLCLKNSAALVHQVWMGPETSGDFTVGTSISLLYRWLYIGQN